MILFEQWARHPLLIEKVVRPRDRAHRPISISYVPGSEGIEIRKGCKFVSSLVTALGKLPGGVGRFLPCSVVGHMSRLRHLGWSQCSHGLTPRPLESCHRNCLHAVCGVLGYPKGAAAELLDGTLKLRYSTLFLPDGFSLGLFLDMVERCVKGVVQLPIRLMMVATLLNGSG